MSNGKNQKIYMWYRVQKLHKDGFNKSQISIDTGLDRATVRKYLQMSEDEFHAWIRRGNALPKKLEAYLPFVRKQLEGFSGLSAAQIEDRLREHFPDMPKVHSKTVYNFVQLVRERYGLAKPRLDKVREMEKLPEPPYGQQAQVDFGQTWMQTTTGKRVRIYFFAMVLSRSRYKYVCFSRTPFTTRTSIAAHEEAFRYFNGYPREVLYDQDSVFIHQENLGDYQLTSAFAAYLKSRPFKAVFCRKADPQSKGKVENVVKYVKQNFLRGRKFTDITLLNQEGQEWLSRTANAKVHSGTQKVPAREWQTEQGYLLRLSPSSPQQEAKGKLLKVRKDNTIAYRGNFYSVPAGTYQGKDSQVLISTVKGKLTIYTPAREFIASHRLGLGKGEYIRNTDHRREKSQTIAVLEQEVLQLLGGSDLAHKFLKFMHQDRPRYYRDNLHYLHRHYKGYDQQVLTDTLFRCIEGKTYNAKTLCQLLDKTQQEHRQDAEAQKQLQNLAGNVAQTAPDIEEKVSQSPIETYEKLFKTWNKH